MSTPRGSRPRCVDCGAHLRRGRQEGQRCDPCQRRAPRLVLPEGFYDQPELEAALAEWEFGPVVCAIREAQRWSQEALGEFLGVEQGRISRIETGTRPLLNVREVVGVANKLAIPAGKLGFTHGVTVGGGTTTGQKGSWVHRRNFVEHVAALTVAITGATALDLDRLRALLPEAEPTGTRHIGAADVETIEQATATFSDQDFAAGSGPVRDLAVGQLRAVLPLLDAQMTPDVRPRLYLATARLATQAGWMSFDVKDDEAARRLWLIALNILRDTDHPLSTDQTVFVLYDMALQAVALGRPTEALRLAQLGHTAALGAHPVSAATASCLAAAQARAYAALGEASACQRTLSQAVEHFHRIEPAQQSWADFLDEPMLARLQGVAHYELALTDRDPHAAGHAVSLLRQAVDSFGSSFAKPRARCLPDLAGAHAIAGDTDTAVRIGHQAIDAVSAVHSPQTYDRLRVLNTALHPLHTSPGVAELRERLTTGIAAESTRSQIRTEDQKDDKDNTK